MSDSRTLWLMRHARAAEFAPGLSDEERPLTESGVGQATAVGDFLRENSVTVDHVLCSVATRTRQTCEALGLPAPVTHSRDLYNAAADTIAQCVTSTFGDEVRVGLVIGHAPGIPALVHDLADETSDATAVGQIEFGFPTGTLVELTVSGAWADLQSARVRSVRLGS